MKFPIIFLSSLLASIAIVMPEEVDESITSMWHDVEASILEEKINRIENNGISSHPFSIIKASITYKKHEIRIEPSKLRNHNKDITDYASGTSMDQVQEGEALEECELPSTTKSSSSLLKQELSTTRKGNNEKIDYGHLHRRSCSSSTDVYVPNNNLIGEINAFMEHQKSSSSAITRYCFPIPDLEYMEQQYHHHYQSGFNDATTGIQDLHDEYDEYDEYDNNDDYHTNILGSTPSPTDSEQRHFQASNCGTTCFNLRPVVDFNGAAFQIAIHYCIGDGTSMCPYSYDINCWDKSRVSDMYKAFFQQQTFNKP
jgi:hypothetical protein